MATLSLKILAAPDTDVTLLDPLRNDISNWLDNAQPKTTAAFAKLIDSAGDHHDGEQAQPLEWLEDDILRDIALEQETLEERQIGIAFSAKKAFHLKDPLNFLFGLAKQYRCEFSVILDSDGQQDEVCFFGFEEGRPDMYEVAQYLGME